VIITPTITDNTDSFAKSGLCRSAYGHDRFATCCPGPRSRHIAALGWLAAETAVKDEARSKDRAMTTNAKKLSEIAGDGFDKSRRRQYGN
jgi:hypothetical protein